MSRKLAVAVAVAVAVVAVLFTACNKDKKSQSVLNIVGINDSKSQVVNVKLKSMEQQTFSIGCYNQSSEIFDAKNKTFGYQDCNKVYRIIDIETGVEIKQIPLPVFIMSAEIDTIRNVIIGQYYNGKSNVLTIDLNNGIISDNQLNTDETWTFSISFFRDIENEYAWLRSDSAVLVFFNPYTGDIIRTLNIEENAWFINRVYDRKNNRLIGVTEPSRATREDDSMNNYIVTVDLSTGKTLSRVIAQGDGQYHVPQGDYDAETNSIVLFDRVNNEVFFYDVATGEIKERYKLDFEITSLKVWRSSK